MTDLVVKEVVGIDKSRFGLTINVLKLIKTDREGRVIMQLDLDSAFTAGMVKFHRKRVQIFEIIFLSIFSVRGVRT